MSATAMLTSSANAVKLYGAKTWLQAMRRSCIGHMQNRGVFYYPPELNGKSPGDSINYDYVGKLTAIPIGEGGTLDGSEEALDIDDSQMVMNVSRIGVLSPNKNTIEQQRTHIMFDEVAVKQSAKRAMELLDTSAFQHLAGAYPTSLTVDGTTYSGSNRLHIAGHNTPIAPTTNRVIRAGSAANDQSLTSSNTFTLVLIDYALELADRANQPLDRLDGETFDLYVSPEQLTDLQHDTSSAVQWYDIQLATLQSGRESNQIENAYKNDIICAGKYRNVWIYSSPRVAYGVNSSSSAVITTVRRAVLVGSDAISFMTPFGGRKSEFTVGNAPVKVFEQLKDYDYYKGKETRLIYGMRKNVPDSHEDIGVIVISSYAAAHT